MIIALNNIRSLHNVGAIFRCADAVAAEMVLLGGLTPVPPRDEIEKTALGATKTVKWEYSANLSTELKKLKLDGYTVYALEQTPCSTSIFETRFSEKVVLIVGHEREGVEQSILDLCDFHVEIPMYGKSAKSLNVSTATSVALYAIKNSATTSSAI